MFLQENTLFDLDPLFDLDVKQFAQYPLHHVTYGSAKFEVATSNGYGGDAFIQETSWTDVSMNIYLCPFFLQSTLVCL